MNGISYTLVPRSWLPIGGLVLATGSGLGLLVLKMILTGRAEDFYLAWNLFLAWLPLVFAWAACREWTPRRTLRWRFWGFGLLWVLFFPNAPYIFTDLVHLPPANGIGYWIDLVLILLFALTGTVAGFVSLYLMHQLVRRRFGWGPGWMFVISMAGMSSLGVYLGRFLRWNSWDAFLNPFTLAADVTRHFAQWPGYKHGPAFLVLFSVFMLVSYLLLYLLVYLPRPRNVSEVDPAGIERREADDSPRFMNPA